MKFIKTNHNTLLRNISKPLKNLLICFFAVLIIFFGENLNFKSFAQSSLNTPGVATFSNSEAKNQNYIKYHKESSSGTFDLMFYTTYLPPSGTFNSPDEHILTQCEDLSSDALDRIGNKCMIKFPKDCVGYVGGTAVPGQNCLNYSQIFENVSSKKLRPIKCDSTKTDKINCLDVTAKTYCHQISNPILGINCKLAPCSFIDNTKYRRPGVNCLADCNSSDNKSISQPKFFMEGINCLSSCKTSSSKNVGVDCVFEFNNYVFPLCSNPSSLFKHYNVASSSGGRREKCLDLEDLPMCDKHPSFLPKINCTQSCTTQNTNLHNIDCTDLSINKNCHQINNFQEDCTKTSCTNLTPLELSSSNNFNRFSNDSISTQKYCLVDKTYTAFSFNQLSTSGYNGYLKDYTLADMPCGSIGDTEQDSAVLSSPYFNPSSSGNIIDLVKEDCKNSTTNSVTNVDIGCTSDKLNPLNSSYKKEFLYNTLKMCKSSSATQAIRCIDYKEKPTVKPYDCNASSMNYQDSCPASNPYCYCSQSGQEYCYRTKIDCTLPENITYDICKDLTGANYSPDIEDQTVSWFFRPNLPWETLQVTEATKNLPDEQKKYITFRMEGDPIENPPTNSSPNGNLSIPQWMMKDIGILTFDFHRAITPSCQANKLGVRGIGLPYICGMNSDFRNIPSNEALYFKGEVNSIFGANNSVDHRVTICVRSMNSGALTDTSCGWRKCRCDCTLVNCDGAWCGTDLCRTVSIKNQIDGAWNSRPCYSDSEHFYYNNPNFAQAFSDPAIISALAISPFLGPLFVPLATLTSMSTLIKESIEASKRTKPCMTTFQDSADNEMRLVRVRAYKPKPELNYICAVSEHFGIMTDISDVQHFFDGDEYFLVPVDGATLIEGKRPYQKLCVSGKFNEFKGICENGFNTNEDKYNTQVWRTAKVVKYINTPPTHQNYGDENDERNQNLTRDDATGYFTLNDQGIEYDEVDKNGNIVISSKLGAINHSIGRVGIYKRRLYEKSDCIKHTSRVPTPPMFNEANRINSRRLFLPPIRIYRICNSSSSCSDQDNTITDFYKPAIQVSWGQIENPLSTDFNTHTNYKQISISPSENESSVYKIIPLGVGFDSSVDNISNEIVLKKEYDIDKNPTACLYQRIESTNPAIKPADKLIKCIPRKMATKVTINALSNSRSYDNYNFHIKYNDDGISGLTSTSFEFSKITDFSNLKDLKSCNNNTSNQGYPVCLERNKCTMLNYECVENERNLIIEKYKAEPNPALIRQYEATSDYCKNNLLILCNKSKDLTPTELNSTLNTNVSDGFNAPSQNNNYGWHNEVCIVSGIEMLDDISKRKFVIQDNPVINKATDERNPNALGTCVKKSGSPNDCQIFDSEPVVTNIKQKARPATPHELGLCFELTGYLKTCRPINFGRNPDSSDPFWTSNLVNPHISHKNRTDFNNQHAEFDISFPGNTIHGSCNGFWKQNTNPPKATCSDSGELTNLINPCIRYVCPKITAPDYGADSSGDYPNTYDQIPNILKSQRGLFHGYAKWDAIMSSDVKINQNPQSCLVGFKKINSTIISKNSIMSNSKISTSVKVYYNTAPSAVKLIIQSLYEDISGYTGGINPSRNCNQLGQWEEVTNSCQRITCPSLENLPKPSDANSFDMNDYIFSTSGNIISLSNSPNSNLANTTKVKFSLSNSINSNSIYLNPTTNSAYNNFPLKDSYGNNITQILANKTYVFELNGNSWKKLDNSMDETYRWLWSAVGGAKFDTGYAWRSNTNSYSPNADDLKDQHIVKGVCQTDLGYRQLEGSPSPQLLCDSNGNWILKNIRNQCVSDCSAVNMPVAEDQSHGYSLWRKSFARVGSSETISAEDCVAGYFKYPYNPPYDEEGNKGDYGYISGTRNDVVHLGTTSDSFDGVATTSDGANYIALNLPESEYNYGGAFYDLKVLSQSSSQSTSESQDSGGIGDTIFQLFNPSASLTLQASANSVWSKIKFVSYGTPDFSDYNNLKINEDSNGLPLCHSEYSKLISAINCIGKNSCTLNLSQFKNFETLSCENNINYGNGQNGSITTNSDIGSGGGGGGGNILNPGTDGGLAGKNGGVGKSYCDRNININNSCRAVMASNKGLKVDLTQANSGFDGGNGSAIIKYYNNNSCSGTPTTTNFNTSGINSYTVPGSTSNDYCIEYEITGAGGGGGGIGPKQGTDGSSGTKVSGKFLAKGGKIIKIYVGVGGKAGKTGCIRPAVGTTSSLENYYINPQQIIKQDSSKFAYNSSKSNSLTKIFNKISNIFISEGYAQSPLGSWSCQTIDTRKTQPSTTCDYPNNLNATCTNNPSVNCGSGNSCSVIGNEPGGYISGSSPFKTLCKINIPSNWSNDYIYFNWEYITKSDEARYDPGGVSIIINNGTEAETQLSDNSQPTNTPSGSKTKIMSIGTASSTRTFGVWIKADGDTSSTIKITNIANSCPSGFFLNSSRTSCNKACDVSATQSQNFNTGTSSYTLMSESSNKTCFGTAYTGSATLLCNADGTVSVSSYCSCASGFAKEGVSNTCLKQCSVNNVAGIVNQTILEGTRSLTCNTSANFTGSATLTCSDSGTVSVTSACQCNSNYIQVGSSCKIKCPIDANLYSNKGFTINSGDFAYNDPNGNKTYNCTGTGYSNSTATFACSSAGTLNFTPCSCAAGYFNSNGTCLENVCTSFTDSTSANGRGINWNSLSDANKKGVKTGLNCNASNTFTGTFDHKCETNNGSATITRNGCTCTQGNAFDTSITPNTCIPIKCTVADGTGYYAQSTYATSTLNYTPIPTNLNATSSFKCTKPGYYGNKKYTCKDNTTPSTIGILTISTCSTSSDSTCNCMPVTCTMPASANSNIEGQTLTPSQWPSTTPTGWPTSGSITSNETSFTCKIGYRSPGASLRPSYNCEYSLDSSNSPTYKTNITNACVIVTCDIFPLGSVNYNASQVNYDCSQLSGYFGQGTYECNQDGVGKWITPCKVVKCIIPNSTSPACPACTPTANSPCPACSGVAQNSIQDGREFPYTPVSQDLICKDGYESSSNKPSFKCIYDSASNGSKLELSGSPCQIIKCQANSNLNSIIDDTIVNWSNNTFVQTSCKDGFYQDPAGPPKYSCNNFKVYSIQNPCLPIVCKITSSTAKSFGLKIDSEIDWSPSPKTINCNKEGFSGTFTYTCTGSNQPNGTLSISSNNCSEQVCDSSFGSKNSSTFATFVSQSNINTGGTGGGTNPIISGFDFLKGGKGADSSISFTSGAGGGAGQASMITIDNKIIAIGGGGSGGSGGGNLVNLGSEQFYNLIDKLQSNVFGNYLILSISNIGIYNNPQDTAGLLYDLSSNNQISHSAPNGKFINDVIFTSYGNPTLPSSISSSPFTFKHGTCKTDVQSNFERLCISNNKCEVLDLPTNIPSQCTSPSMGILSSYLYGEPTLNANNKGALKIKEYNSTNQLTMANISNGNVYSFYKTGGNWIKFNTAYRDEYLVEYGSAVSEIKIRFHRTNSTFEPRFKIVNSQGATLVSALPIKKNSTDDLSIGYIKTGVEYVLRNKGSYWEIKKYISEYASSLSSSDRQNPKRTCMTIRLANNNATSWSGTDSKCVKKCPSGDYDDRIGAGATLHKTHIGTGKILWPEADLGSTIENKVYNSRPINGIFNQLSVNEINTIKPSDFSSGNKWFFIASRKCNLDGTWSDPLYSCKISGGGSPPDSQNVLLNIGNREYSVAGSETLYTQCAPYYLPNTDSSEYLVHNQKQTPSFKCIKPASDLSNDAYLAKQGGDNCIQYCGTNDINNSQGKYIKPNPQRYFKQNGTISLDCNQGGGWGYSLGSNGVRDPNRKPTFTCGASSSWNNYVINDCLAIRKCYVSDLNITKKFKDLQYTDGTYDDEDEDYEFNILSFLNSSTIGSTEVNDGFYKHFEWNCGYCAFSGNRSGSLLYEYRYYRSAFIDWVKCNDGVWEYKPYKGNYYWDRACDGDDWDWHDQCEECHPDYKFIGWCSKTGSEFNKLARPNDR